MRINCFSLCRKCLFGLSLSFAFKFVFAETVHQDQFKDFVYRAQNPLSDTYSIPLQYTYHGGAIRGGVSVGSLAPIFPISLGDWNLINQMSLNFIGTPGEVTGIEELPQPLPGSGASGLGDLEFTSFLTPSDPGQFIWGIGPTFVFPTDYPSRELGSGKFSVGPALMMLTQPKPWTVGLQIKQIWSVIGSDGRDDVSQMVLQPFINYNLPDNWYLVSDMDMIANWESSDSQRWTVPIGAGIGKLFSIDDSHAINSRLEGYYNVISPDDGPEWSVNFTLQFMFLD